MQHASTCDETAAREGCRGNQGLGLPCVRNASADADYQRLRTRACPENMGHGMTRGPHCPLPTAELEQGFRGTREPTTRRGTTGRPLLAQCVASLRDKHRAHHCGSFLSAFVPRNVTSRQHPANDTSNRVASPAVKVSNDFVIPRPKARAHIDVRVEFLSLRHQTHGCRSFTGSSFLPVPRTQPPRDVSRTAAGAAPRRPDPNLARYPCRNPNERS